MKIHSDTKDSLRSQHHEEDGILGEMDDIGYDRSTRPSEGNLLSVCKVMKKWGRSAFLSEILGGLAP